MTTTYFNLASGDFSQDWSNTGLITTDDNWDGVASIVGYRGDDVTGATGVDPRTLSGDGTVVIDVNANQTNPNTFSTGGVAEFAIANPTVALNGSGTADAPYIVLYLDGTGRQNLHLDVDIRDLDASTDNAVQPLNIQYRVGAVGAWTNVPGGYIADATSGPSTATLVTHLSLDLPSALDGQSQIQLRFMTSNAVGNDEWVGVDNIGVTSVAQPPDTTAPTLSSSTPADGGTAGTTANLTLQFNETVKAGAGSFTLTGDGGDVRVISASDASQVSYSGQVVTIDPAAALNPTETYHLSVAPDAITDLAGNAYAGTGGNPIDFFTFKPDPKIYEIQGTGHTSAYVGQHVVTEGIVTAIDTTGSRGFWIQDETGDGDAATSDAVFVFTNTTVSASVHVGDKVSVEGTVNEFQGADPNNLTITEVGSSLANVHVIGTGTIAPTLIGGPDGLHPPAAVVEDDGFTTFDPAQDGADFFESLEGMLVTVKDAQVVDATSGNSTWIVADNGADATGMNSRGGISISGGDLNPEKIQIFADSGVTSLLPSYVAGDHPGDVTGVISYFGGQYELLPTAIQSLATAGSVPRETTTLAAGDADHVTIGAYNVENLDPTDPQSKFEQLAVDITSNLGAPDILGLEEIQDADGAGNGTDYSGAATLNKLIDAIVAAGGPHYQFIEIAPTANNANGGEPNGNIRQAFLYNPDRVQYVAGSAHQLFDNDPTNGDAYNNSRHPLVADFVFHGETITAIDVHNYSRGGSDEPFGLDQPPINSGEQRRIDQTTPVKQYVEGLVAADPHAHVAVMGDFNGFQFELSQTQLESGGALTNLTNLLPVNEQFSYAFEGNMQQIDHLFVSPSLQTGAEFDIVHLNTGVSVRPTDHDPIVSRLFVNTAPVAVADTGYVATEDTALTVDALNGLLANDTDLNGDALTVALQSGPAHGSLTLNADGSFSYTPVANYNGPDSFSYLVHDPSGAASNVATVSFQVAAVNDTPVAVADTAAVAEDQTVVIDVLGNDTDVDLGDSKTLVSVSATAKGASVSIVDGKVVYQADADSFDLLTLGQSTTDTFTYQMKDAAGATSTAAVTVTISGVADGPSQAGGNGADTLTGTAADERVDGGNGADRLLGGEGADTLIGGGGDDVLLGGAGIDSLSGGSGVDVLDGGAGSDWLAGGKDGDRFVFSGSFGKDVVADFENGDRLMLDHGQFANYTAVMSHAAQVGADVVITLDAANSITLMGLQLSSLKANDFMFA
jgi:VCBS repeat-containing protein